MFMSVFVSSFMTMSISLSVPISMSVPDFRRVLLNGTRSDILHQRADRGEQPSAYDMTC